MGGIVQHRVRTAVVSAVAIVATACGDPGPTTGQREQFAILQSVAAKSCAQAAGARELADAGPAEQDRARASLQEAAAALRSLSPLFTDAGLSTYVRDFPLSGTAHAADLLYDGILTGEMRLFAEGSALLEEGCLQIRSASLD